MKTTCDQMLTTGWQVLSGPSMRATSLVPTPVRSQAPVCPQQERPRRDEVLTSAVRSTTVGTAADTASGIAVGFAAPTDPGLLSSAPPIT